jgi:hypothetical protein
MAVAGEGEKLKTGEARFRVGIRRCEVQTRRPTDAGYGEMSRSYERNSDGAGFHEVRRIYREIFNRD